MKRKRDFQNKNFNNPCFKKTPKDRGSKLFKRIVGVICFLGLVVFLYIINTHPFFQIDKIEISGNQYVSGQTIRQVVDEQLAKRRLLAFNQRNIFFFSKSKLKKELRERLNLEDVRVKKSYFDTLKIFISENPVAIIWSANGQKFHIDNSGTAIRQAVALNANGSIGEEEAQLIRSDAVSDEAPVVVDLSQAEVSIGQTVLDPDRLNFITDLAAELGKIADFGIARFEVKNASFLEITLYSQEGWQAMFKTEEDAKIQARLLAMVLAQKVKNRAELEYIDLRYGEKIYWK